MKGIERDDQELRAVASKRRWTWEDAKVVLEALDRSGIPIAAFCRKYEVNYFRVLQWNQRRRKAKSAQAEKQIFMPLRVIDDIGSKQGVEKDRSSWAVQITVCDCTICVAEGASEAVVSRAVRAARETSC